MKHFKIVILCLSLFSFMEILTACGPQKQTITASEVKDTESLKRFVLAARNHLENDYAKAVEDFRTKPQWKYGAIYLFGIDKNGLTIFHVKTPDFEGQKIRIIDEASGEEITKKLMDAGFKRDGDFVEYRFDNPATELKDRSLKVSYAVPFRREGKEDFIVGAGFYPE